ncbi:histidyl-tRNA ligase [Psychroflexus gondwanensis ACAM 44]|uniref:Histidine--tRNA ligase n=1 Tax=Psychroflexus gondwanensis ACAM 44 TaxID=1189619 RepID=N1X006_9FLAO|nr:histidine--tRNA ligase [Psychroflexus gondwanensis]EMY81453.1 histidyl-tRNA ligase [Psychroflexus gondwanensis ACAM 44]
MASKASIPKGTRDFSPVEVSRRHYIISTIEKHFKTFGFQPIETPTFENSETLMGKYGDEGDRLIFKILNSGDFLRKVNSDVYNSQDSLKLSTQISEKALKYDLTVPFARYVVQHQNEIDFPFKRYQIQNVYRADRPQKGRFREFLQCDADVIGSDSLWQEVEFIQLYDAVFSSLGLEGVTIKMNNRKILSGLAEVIEESDKLIDFTVALDKLDKIGEEGVKKEMLEKGISENALKNIQPIFSLEGNFSTNIKLLKSLLSDSEVGQRGIQELEFIEKALQSLPLKTAQLDLDVTLARGLNYYTGAIFEISAPEEVKMGSIGGGGRYDDLTGIFGLKNMSGVGVSFGLDRIYLVLEELDLFPKAIEETTKVLFINFGEEEALYALKAVNALRAASVAAELYPDADKMKKQMTYADKRNIPFVVLAGGTEMQSEVYNVKYMKSGEQESFNLEELIKKLSNY